MEFAELEEEVIIAYIASGEPMDKAGAYGIQVSSCHEVYNICWLIYINSQYCCTVSELQPHCSVTTNCWGFTVFYVCRGLEDLLSNAYMAAISTSWGSLYIGTLLVVIGFLS